MGDGQGGAVQLLVCTAGIWGCFLLYGLAQERVWSFAGVGGAKFGETQFLLLFEHAFATMVAQTACLFTAGAVAPDKAWAGRMVRYFVVISGAQMGAKYASNEALRSVSYPIQALAKSSKTIPAMFGAFFSGKRFTVLQWCCALGITSGTALFTVLQKSKPGKETQIAGVVLLVLSLFCDGGVSGQQVAMKLKEKTTPSTYQMMCWTNVGAFLMMLPMATYTGSAVRGYEYVAANPDFVQVLALFAVTSAFGQVFIFLTIRTFGPDTCAKITTVRKMGTVLVSIFWYGHPVSFEQWCCVGLVFGSVIAELLEQMLKGGHKVAPGAAKRSGPSSGSRKKKD